ncbi:MAG: translation initiation factor IF-2 [Ruminococcaceae bacterium]|nr:translation initiation factor IF-2 [Oscillospiraceae bacterium]
MFKVSQLAKDLHIKNKDMLTKLEETGVSVKSYMATLEPDDFNLFFDELTKGSQIKDLDGYLHGKTKIARKPKEEPKPEVKPEAKPEPKPAAKPEVKPEPKPAAKPEAKPEPKPAAKPEVKPEPKPAAKPEVKPEPKPEVKPEVKPEPKPEPKPEAKPAPVAQPPKSVTESEEKANVKTQEKNDIKPENKPAAPQQPKPQQQNQPRRDDRRPGDFRPQGERPQNGQFGDRRPQGERPQNNQFGDRRPQGERPQNNQFGDRRPQGDRFQNGQFGDRRPMQNQNQNQNAPRPAQPKPQPQQPGVERKKTGNTRVIDTRTTNVDLSKYDERFETMAGDNADAASGKQKLKKQNTRDMRSAKNRDKERLAMEKLRKENLEKLKKMPLKITLPDEITVGELAQRLKKTAAEVVKKMMMNGMMVTVNQVIDYDTAYLIADEFGAKVTKEVVVSIEDRLFSEEEEHDEDMVTRAPVVCVMGHVDHGKTSLLDAIRHTSVTTGEAGGITQHIGAYRVSINDQPITFLDTPGHEAFTAMRARGAQATDIAILVVAADDGIMPQTIEAINHAKAAGIDVIVAINKMDKPTANPDTVKNQLTAHSLVPEEWGGDTICVPVSALTGMGIDDLLESVLLVAEVKELKANPHRRAKGIVIEAKLDKGRGPVATVIVQNGTLHAGDIVIAGTSVGRVRAMTNDRGEVMKEAGPSMPVEIVGLAEVPQAGDEFNAVEDERMARTLADQRREKARTDELNASAKVNLEDLFSQIKDGVKELNIIVKADVGGSAEAVKASLEKISNEEVKVRVIHSAVGGIRESDVMLAASSNAIIVGFNVRPDKNAADMAERDHVDVRTYRIIYECIEEIEAAMKGMLAPEFKEVVLGRAEVRQTIRVPNVGTIAGSYIMDGKVTRQSQIRIVRDGVVIFEDKISSLKRFKDDVKEVAQGYECGIGLEKYDDIHVGDVLEAFIMEEVER